MADIIDGKRFAAQWRVDIARQVVRLKESHGLTPGLAVILVGEDPASQVYVHTLKTACRQHRIPPLEFSRLTFDLP